MANSAVGQSFDQEMEVIMMIPIQLLNRPEMGNLLGGTSLTHRDAEVSNETMVLMK